jgi:hypothetical protein
MMAEFSVDHVFPIQAGPNHSVKQLSLDDPNGYNLCFQRPAA